MTLVVRPGFAYDTDASNYIDAVEAADQADTPGIGAMEAGVRYAINDFVLGCKADGIWTAIKNSCILAGAKTLEGSFIDIKSCTKILANNNFADGAFSGSNYTTGDYNRKTGLVGNGSTKYLDSNRSVGADNQDSHHLGLYITTATTGINNYIGRSSGGTDTYLHIGGANGNETYFRSKSGATAAVSVTNLAAPFFAGLNRSSNSAFNVRAGSNISSLSVASKSLTSGNIEVFRDPGNAGFVNGRLAFYSIGESLNLAALGTRVTTLINQFGAAIP